eukprot:351336-Pleurochrysis_carterae.AAC.2
MQKWLTYGSRCPYCRSRSNLEHPSASSGVTSDADDYTRYSTIAVMTFLLVAGRPVPARTAYENLDAQGHARTSPVCEETRRSLSIPHDAHGSGEDLGAGEGLRTVVRFPPHVLFHYRVGQLLIVTVEHRLKEGGAVQLQHPH